MLDGLEFERERAKKYNGIVRRYPLSFMGQAWTNPTELGIRNSNARSMRGQCTDWGNVEAFNPMESSSATAQYV